MSTTNPDRPEATPRQSLRQGRARAGGVGLAAVLLGAGLLVAPTAGSAAQGPWQPFTTLSATTGADAVGPVVATAPDGAVTAVWRRNDGTHNLVESRTRPAGATVWGPVQRLSTAGVSSVAPAIAVAPDGTTTVAWTAALPTGTRTQVTTRTHSTAAWTAPVTVSGRAASGPSVAVGADGTTAVLSHVADSGTNFQPHVAVRAPGGTRWTASAVVPAGTPTHSPSLAVGPDGSVTVAFEQEPPGPEFYLVNTRTLPAGSSTWRPVVRATPAGEEGWYPRLGFARDGTATVVWLAPDSTDSVLAATRRPGASAWSSPVAVSGGTDAGAPRLAVAPDGSATVAWLGYDDYDRVEVVRRSAAGAWGQPLQLSGTNGSDPADVEELALAVNAAGSVAVAWDRDTPGELRVRVTVTTKGYAKATKKSKPKRIR